MCLQLNKIRFVPQWYDSYGCKRCGVHVKLCQANGTFECKNIWWSCSTHKLQIYESCQAVLCATAGTEIRSSWLLSSAHRANVIGETAALSWTLQVAHHRSRLLGFFKIQDVCVVYYVTFYVIFCISHTGKLWALLKQISYFRMNTPIRSTFSPS